MSVTVGNIRRTNYDVTFGGADLGGLDKVDLSKLALLLEPVKVGTTGNMKLDDRYVGLEDKAAITIQVREVTRAMIEKAFPWFSGTTGAAAVELTPVVNTLVAATYAAALILHPHDMGATVTQDIEIYKAVPASPPVSRDGTKDDVWEITFMVYPDLSKLPNSCYGRVKPAP